VRSVLVIGCGRFGRLLCGHLAEHAEVVVCDAREIAEAPAGVRVGSIADAGWVDAVIPAVNVQAFEGVLRAIGPLVRAGTLVADVSSVKVEPLAMMERLLPGGVELLGTHPLFGPQSVAEKGLRGQRIAMCPVRVGAARSAWVRGFLAGTLGLEVIEVRPDEHDRQMALVQVLTHLVGHAAAELELADLPLGTLAYRRLRQLATNIAGDSDELFDAIQSRNPYAAGTRARFVAAVERVRRRAGDEIG